MADQGTVQGRSRRRARANLAARSRRPRFSNRESGVDSLYRGVLGRMRVLADGARAVGDARQRSHLLRCSHSRFGATGGDSRLGGACRCAGTSNTRTRKLKDRWQEICREFELRRPGASTTGGFFLAFHIPPPFTQLALRAPPTSHSFLWPPSPT